MARRPVWRFSTEDKRQGIGKPVPFLSKRWTLEQDMIATASIGRSHGVEGFLRVTPYSGSVEHLLSLDEGVALTREGREVRLSVDAVRMHADCLLMRFVGYSQREKAQRLSGSVLYVRREKASALEEGEYYIADLYGLALVSGGRTVGKVEAVADGAQADYLIVRTDDGRSVIVPNMAPFVSRPDFEHGTIELLEPAILER